jgi:hypothetical protein
VEEKKCLKIIMLFCLCMRCGVDEPHEVTGGFKLPAKQLTHSRREEQERAK